jgi:hypothetical protein
LKANEARIEMNFDHDIRQLQRRKPVDSGPCQTDPDR